jgi:hypothetical protein
VFRAYKVLKVSRENVGLQVRKEELGLLVLKEI